MVELLVATSITLVMLFLIDRVFFDTTQAIGQGVALSKIMSQSRTISEQLERDARAMVGPKTPSGGFLVILNKQIAGVNVIDYVGNNQPRAIQSDQLLFISEAKSLEAIAPGSTNNYANTAAGAKHVRVWYGHVLRTNPNGTGPGGGGLGAVGSPNEIGTEWILGRQALFLRGLPTGFAGVHAITALYDSDVDYAMTNPFGGGEKLYMGLADVCDDELGDITVVGTGTAIPPQLGDGLPSATYALRSYEYIFGQQRLRVNPKPNGNTFESWKIAQMHPYFMENVSDFFVEFAGDYEDNTNGNVGPDGLIDTDMVGGTGTGDIKWYHDSNPPAVGVGGFNDPTVPIPPITPTSPFYDTAPGLAHADGAFVWRHNDDSATNSRWPTMIRLRYRLHDRNGRFNEEVSPGVQQGGKWFEKIIRVKRPK